MKQIIQRLSQMHMFRDVSTKHINEFVAQCQSNSKQIGEVICTQGEQASHAMLLLHGKLSVSVSTGENNRHVGEVHPGEIFGEQGLFHSNGIRNATVIANESSTCLILTPKLMRVASSNDAVVALERHLIATMARRIRSTNLAIQKAWKESQQVEEKVNEQSKHDETSREEQNNSLLDRLKKMFGGSQ